MWMPGGPGTMSTVIGVDASAAPDDHGINLTSAAGFTMRALVQIKVQNGGQGNVVATSVRVRVEQDAKIRSHILGASSLAPRSRHFTASLGSSETTMHSDTDKRFWIVVGMIAVVLILLNVERFGIKQTSSQEAWSFIIASFVGWSWPLLVPSSNLQQFASGLLRLNWQMVLASSMWLIPASTMPLLILQGEGPEFLNWTLVLGLVLFALSAISFVSGVLFSAIKKNTKKRDGD